MLPGPLTPPAPSGTVPRRRRPALSTVVGLLLLVGGLAGSLVWFGAVSPLGFTRFPVLDGDRTLTFREGGRYVVFEEFRGASERRLPSPLDITVIDRSGNEVPVTTRTSPGDDTPDDAYDLLVYEGRAVAEFDVPRGGRYLLRVRIREAGRFSPEEYDPAPGATIAVGRGVAASWVAYPAVGLLVGPVPAVAGGLVLVLGPRRRRRREGDEDRPGD